MPPRPVEQARSSSPLKSAVHWALLGLVIERPSYGYELGQRFEREYGESLRISSVSYVYEALKVLRRHGLIEEFAGSGGGAQPKPRYRATEEGVAAYQEHLISEVIEDRRRSRVSARKLAVLERQPELALELIARLRETCLQEAMRSSPPTSRSGATLNAAPSLGARLAVEDGRLASDAKLAWLDYAARELKALIASRPTH